MSHDDSGYNDALTSVRQIISRSDACTPKERQELEADLAELEKLVRKMETGRLDIAVFGEISTGKSALINALLGYPACTVDPRGGSTIGPANFHWDSCSYTIPGQQGSIVMLVDTPGINEVRGEQRGQLARQCAERADLIVFVTDSDLNHEEWLAIKLLAQARKPIIVVLNKADNYTPAQRQRLIEVLRDERLKSLVDPRDIVLAAADPGEREIEIESSDGKHRTQWRKAPADVAALKARILEVLESDGKALMAVNSAMYANDKNDRIVAVKVRARDQAAQKTIYTYAALKGTAVAVNPVPLADVAGGLMTDGYMVYAIGRVYGESITPANAGGLALSIAESAGWVTAATYATHALAGLIKFSTFGLGTLVTALPQGLAAAYGSYVVGQAAKFYFENHCGWAGLSPKQVIRTIIRSTNRGEVIGRLRAAIEERLRVNRHAANVQTIEAEAEKTVAQAFEQTSDE